MLEYVPMNVLHIDEQSDWRGGEQQASWLIQGTLAAGHTIALAGKPGAPFLERAAGDAHVPTLALPFRGEGDLYTAWRLARYMREAGVDILHAHTSHAHAAAIVARILAGRGKVVVSRRVSFVPRANPFNRWKYNAPDLYLAVSGEVGHVLRAYGLPESKVAVVHSSVDLSRCDVPPLPRAELGVAEDAYFIFSAGALVEHKDHALLLDVFARFHATHPHARLRIAGEGVLRGALERAIAAMGLGEAVALLGHRRDVPRITRAADLYVSSSVSEGLGTSILEALACGTPVVATQAGGAAEMVRPEATGWLVPVRDADALAAAMLEAYASPEQARAMAIAGRALVEEEYTAPRMVQRTLAKYEELMTAGRE